MNSDHAPTAEEQLPPLDELAGAELHLGYSRDEAALRCRERQLLAALREVEKARGDVEGLRKILQSTEDAWRSQEKQLAEKDAKITQLAQLVERMAETSHGYFQRADAAEAKLRAVSDALQGGEALEKWDAERFAETWGVYTRSEVDVIFARIRAIVEGK